MKRLSETEKMIAVSVLFTLMLLIIRMLYTGTFIYIFYAWNIFLAIVPLYFSRQLAKQQKPGIKTSLLMLLWLLFLPNAPYIITDLFHFTQRPPIALWFDLLLVTSAAWNGLILGIISLMQVEKFLLLHLKTKWVNLIIFIALILCGYGIYLGRFLRYNSWEVFTNPFSLFYDIANHVLQPFYFRAIWEFTILFATMFGIIYFTIKKLAITRR